MVKRWEDSIASVYLKIRIIVLRVGSYLLSHNYMTHFIFFGSQIIQSRATLQFHTSIYTALKALEQKYLLIFISDSLFEADKMRIKLNDSHTLKKTYIRVGNGNSLLRYKKFCNRYNCYTTVTEKWFRSLQVGTSILRILEYLTVIWLTSVNICCQLPHNVYSR